MIVRPGLTNGPHQGRPVLLAGAPFARARGALLLLHGRGAAAEDIMGLAAALDQPDLAYLAPRAAGQTWYPRRFLEPLASNEPWLSSALAAIDDVVAQLGEVGLPPERVMLVGFSQGACLALEYAARHARRYGGVVGLSGGLIGPPDTPRDYPGTLAGTPAFLGCSDVDFHIPVEAVHASAAVLERLGAAVTKRIYPGMGHTVNEDELDAVRAMAAALGRTEQEGG
jgi:predicted esterase